jgi:GNAT superfamily N-acetyltransferase
MSFVVLADHIGEQLTTEIAVLLSRAFTDSRHLADYSAADHERWDKDIEHVHTAAPADQVVMPREWLMQFPTLINLWKDPQFRRPTAHFIERRAGGLAGHVALFEHEFRVSGEEPFAAGFIEDVATDPLEIGSGVATALLSRAAEHARHLGWQWVGLATSIPEFYERLGWLRWEGAVTIRQPGGELPEPGCMVRALDPGAEARLREWRTRELQAGFRLEV